MQVFSELKTDSYSYGNLDHGQDSVLKQYEQAGEARLVCNH